MRWQGRQGSRNVEDRRRSGGGGGGMAVGGGLGVIVLILALLMGGDPGALLEGLQQGPGSGPGMTQGPTTTTGVATDPAAPQADDEAAQFVSVVLADTEKIWGEVFARQGARYREPRLVLYRSRTPSACGTGQAAMGPFYCPADEKIYIDLSFYDDLHRLGAPGDFAMAYVVSHEVGHHVQTILGTSAQVMERRRQLSQAEGNRLSVRQELQADYYAGLWAHHADRSLGVIEPGDIDEALRAASAVGDDRLRAGQGRGAITPDAFTHGTSEQRRRWFDRGYRLGTLEGGDTFSAEAL